MAEQSAELIREDPEWPMPSFPGAPPSPRRLRVWRRAEGTLIAVVTERGPGVSVTNIAERVRAALAAAYPGQPLRLIEHYPPGVDEQDTFHEISAVKGKLRWRPMDHDELIGLCGPDALRDLPPLPPDPDEQRPGGPQPAPPAGPGLADELLLRGYRDDAGALVAIESPTGEPLGLLPHYAKHSPGGFSWGYWGSGPTELARCLLIAVLGAAAACPGCATAAAQGCRRCEAGVVVPPALYCQLRDDIVAEWPNDRNWQLPVVTLRRWLADQPAAPGPAVN